MDDDKAQAALVEAKAYFASISPLLVRRLFLCRPLSTPAPNVLFT
ncbi:Uncharacterised protein [Vibrio cholerae]|nr:Uncharacterised protein [Vibrio cholerae]